MIVEISHIFQDGISLSVRDRELFLSHDNFPWFKYASVAAIKNVELLNEHHLYWPGLDIDLTVKSIEAPDQFPLVAS